MGISGLLPLMKGATSDVRLSKLQGTVAAVDTNGWIHRACYHCGDKIYMNEETEMYINYCINFCTMLKSHSITPILVFDGQSLPAKAETKLQRQKRKQAVRDTIEELLRSGNENKARYLMRTCVDVNFEMVHKVIQRCRKEKIDYLVAPYEADAQITYLVNSGIADYAITEDSDMLAFGCRKTLYKLDREKASGKMIDLSRLTKCFKNFDLQRFQFMCILSGCDYLSNLPGIGIGRSKRYFESLTGAIDDVASMLKNVPIFLKMTEKVKVTDDYIDAFVKAKNTFDYQLVYCPIAQDLTHLNSLKMEQRQQFGLDEYAGQFFETNKLHSELRLPFVINYVLGNVHPKSLDIMDFYNPTEESEDYWFSEIILQRVKNPNSLDAKRKNPDENGWYTKKIKTDLSMEQIESIEVKQECITESYLETFGVEIQMETSLEHQKKRQKSKRNIFRKTEQTGIVRSKYFNTKSLKTIEIMENESDSDPEMPERKSIDLDCTTSSIEDEDITLLKSVNNSLPPTPPLSQSMKRLKVGESKSESKSTKNGHKFTARRSTRKTISSSMDIRSFFNSSR